MAAQEKRANELLEEIGVRVDSKTLVKNLGVGTQQMVEIAKALSQNAKVIVFDEPTSSLTDSEIQELFSIIRLRASATWVCSISATAWRSCLRSATG